MKGVVYPRNGRVCAHAAGVVALVAVERALVVLARREDAHCFAVGEGEDGHFHAFDVVFDYDEISRRSEFLLFEHHAAGRYGRPRRFRAGTRLWPAARPSALTTKGALRFLSAASHSARLVQRSKSEVGMSCFFMKVLEKALLPSRRAPEAPGPTTRDASLAQRVGSARYERRFWPDEYKLYA